jgi:hypothetical protein
MRRSIYAAIIFILLLSAGSVFTACAAEWREYKSTHFIVYSKNAPDDSIRRLTENAESLYNKIADDLGFTRYQFWLWDDRAKIYVYDNAQDFQMQTGNPSWIAGDAIAQQKLIRTFVDARGFLETVLPHELSHIVFREFVGFLNPAVTRWLDEGVALYQEKSKYYGAKSYLQSVKKDGRLVSLSQLESLGAQIMFSQDAAKVFYTSAFTVVDFLISQYGRDSFVTFCQNLRDKKNLGRALTSAYPFSSFDEFDRAWQRHVGIE